MSWLAISSLMLMFWSAATVIFLPALTMWQTLTPGELDDLAARSVERYYLSKIRSLLSFSGLGSGLRISASRRFYGVIEYEPFPSTPTNPLLGCWCIVR